MVLKKENIPNLLSALRLLMIPLFVWIFFSNYKHAQIYSLIVFITAGMTDALDGYLARRNNWITDIGKILDPVADKMMQISALICLSIKQKILFWLAGLIILKELMMVIGGSLVLKKRRDLVVSLWYGKMTTLLLTVSVCVMLLCYNNIPIVLTLSVISAASVLFALFMYYIYVFRRQYKNKTKKKKY